MPQKEEKSPWDCDYVTKEMFIEGLGLKPIGENIQQNCNDHDENADENVNLENTRKEKIIKITKKIQNEKDTKKIQNDKNPKEKDKPAEEYLFEDNYFPEDENENIEQNSENENISLLCTKCPYSVHKRLREVHIIGDI